MRILRAPASINDIKLTVGSNTYSNGGATSLIGPNSLGLRSLRIFVPRPRSPRASTVNVYFTELCENGLLVCLEPHSDSRRGREAAHGGDLQL